jgi:hypothetical protein
MTQNTHPPAESLSPENKHRLAALVRKTISVLSACEDIREARNYAHVSGVGYPQEKNLVGLFKQVVGDWRTSGLPEKTLVTRTGEVWAGIDIPEKTRQKIRLARSAKEGDAMVLTTLLALPFFQRKTARQDVVDLLKFMLASGFSPNEYNGRVTPVGMAAYQGQLDFLKVLHNAGADILLELKAEHGVKPHDIGNTLLHRMAFRGGDSHGDTPERQQVAVWLMETYDDPMPVDGAGHTPLSAARGSMRKVLEPVAIRREKERLSRLAEADTEATPRARL